MKVPPLTIQQRLFVDRWWVNGGDLIDAVTFAQYSGYPQPSDKAKAGRRMLALRSVKAYLEYLRAELKAQQAQQARDKATADQKTGDAGGASQGGVDGASSTGSAGVADGQIMPPVGGSPQLLVGLPDENILFSHGVSGPGGGAVVARYGLGDGRVGTLLPPSAGRGVADAPPEMDPTEIRILLAKIARGNESKMNDSRVRMRAIELIMKNLGMLVDLATNVNVNANANADIGTMTPSQRAAEIAKLDTYLKAAAELESTNGPVAETPQK